MGCAHHFCTFQRPFAHCRALRGISGSLSASFARNKRRALSASFMLTLISPWGLGKTRQDKNIPLSQPSPTRGEGVFRSCIVFKTNPVTGRSEPKGGRVNRAEAAGAKRPQGRGSRRGEGGS